MYLSLTECRVESLKNTHNEKATLQKFYYSLGCRFYSEVTKHCDDV